MSRADDPLQSARPAHNSVLIPVRSSPPSAVGLVLVGAHEVHSVDRDVFLLDGLLHAALVLPEGLGARVTAAVPFQELLGEPAVEALVVLPLQVGAGLPDAVHLGPHPTKHGEKTKTRKVLRRSTVFGDFR